MTDERHYETLFNQGYKLGRYQLELAESLKHGINPNVPNQDAFIDGVQRAEAEREQSRLAELNEAREDSERELER